MLHAQDENPYGVVSSHAPWFPTNKVGSHLVSATLGRPRLDGAVVGMDEDEIVFFPSTLSKMC